MWDTPEKEGLPPKKTLIDWNKSSVMTELFHLALAYPVSSFFNLQKSLSEN